MKLRKRNVLLLFLSALVFGMASVTPASGTTGASTSTLLDGVLRLRLGATDQLLWQSPPGSTAGQITQGILPSGSCGLALDATVPAGANLATFGTGPGSQSVGFVSDAIGIKGSGEGTGQPCGRIDGSQKLTLTLSSRIAPTSGATKAAADFAELDIEGKFGATFTITGSLNGGTPYSETHSTAGPDSGPDSADGDNFRIRFPSTGRFLFNKLEFTVSSGAISLEGGADGTPACSTATGGDCDGVGSLGEQLSGTTDSLIHVVRYDRTLNCGESETQTSAGEPTNTLERVSNESGACTAVPIDLDASVVGSDQFVSLRKDLFGQQAQFFWTVTWTPEDPSLPVTVTQFDFGDGYRDIQWCLADDNDADAYPELPFTASGSDPASARDPWCLTSQHADADLDPTSGFSFTGQIRVKETFLGIGDP
ncbi:MAG TPA: hypothetical protein VFQ40_08380, partial [Actinomycetota bacterium]|nr:hypothetical protein [Actinomycetota bacterium]